MIYIFSSSAALSLTKGRMENDKRKKATHKKETAKGKKQSSKGPAALNTKTALKKRSAYRKRKTTKKDGDNDDNDQLNKKRKESDEHNIDEYIKYHSDLKPSSKLLKEYGEL